LAQVAVITSRIMKPTKGNRLTTYAFPIVEKFLDLLEILNEGVRPAIEEKSTYYIFDTFGRTNLHQTIQFEEDLYDEKGHSKYDLIFVS
jgi:hypothetical protein